MGCLLSLLFFYYSFFCFGFSSYFFYFSYFSYSTFNFYSFSYSYSSESEISSISNSWLSLTEKSDSLSDWTSSSFYFILSSSYSPSSISISSSSLLPSVLSPPFYFYFLPFYAYPVYYYLAIAKSKTTVLPLNLVPLASFIALKALFLFSNCTNANPLHFPVEGLRGRLISEISPNFDRNYLMCFSLQS